MRARFLYLVAVFVVLITAFSPPTVSADRLAPGCDQGEAPRFRDAFLQLKDLLGSVMGEPITCEYRSVASTRVRTSTGVAEWLPTQSRMIFTDGAHTWALTERGLRYLADGIPFASAPAMSPERAAALPRPGACLTIVDWAPTRFGGAYDGDSLLWAVTGVMRNDCAEPLSGAIEITAVEYPLAGGLDLCDLAEYFIGQCLDQDFLPAAATEVGPIAPGKTAEFQVDLNWMWLPAALASGRDASAAAGLADLDASFRAIRPTFRITGARSTTPHQGVPWYDGGLLAAPVDVRVQGGVRELQRLWERFDGDRQRELGDLLVTASASRVGIRMARLPAGVRGNYRLATRTITIDENLPLYGDRAVAAVLAHELQHAADAARGLLAPGADCIKNEQDAFRRQGQIWLALWDGALPPPDSAVVAELDDIAILADRDPVALIEMLRPPYAAQCGTEP